MLTGNGRHRRPRQAPALLVAAGVTGSAIAIPLLAATGASAASGTTWDQVADCKTGGSWSENNGDGKYGGLEIAQEDWEQYGGLDYAARADQASRSQQIAVAEKILADKGVGYWSTCGLLNGLDKDSGSADVDTGVAGDAGTSGSTGLSNSTGSSGSSDSSGLFGSDSSADSSADASSPSPPASPTPSDTPSGPSKTTDDSAKSDASPESDSGSAASQEPDSPSTGATNEGDSDNSWQEGGFSGLVDTGALSGGRHRGGTADESTADTGVTGNSTGRHAARGDSYTVRPGDTLASIADSLGVQGGWRALYDENKEVIGVDPSRIVPGQTLGVGAE
ncbi:peptigoglycan-binding protein LysM [Streptomyces sp. SA15]|uniref:LysM peptidoglycan-binding domain-containing protein n=1 Tax=Streptomyces sp. SA15 TaxID=934019 RepID=UPI000BAFD096|nr:transglycosylase family protein [Streptomyces sp. SA15]PAZ11952.1 peptigoglycan-binding protein LysM [Streptomyces sp. SA15]